MVVRPRIPATLLISEHLRRFLVYRRLSSAASDGPGKAAPPPSAPSASSAAAAEAEARGEAYRQLQNLDFMTATKILFTTPPKRKKFGLDFHLVQLFFACMPSLAVYLVAQYARYEIRRMEAEAEMKKKQAEEEEKAKVAELESNEEGPDSELLKVKVRLDALEETIKEIVDEKKKVPHGKISTGEEDVKKEPHGNVSTSEEGVKKEQVTAADKNSDPQGKAKAGEIATIRSREAVGVSSPATKTAAQEDQKGQPQKVENGEKASAGSKK